MIAEEVGQVVPEVVSGQGGQAEGVDYGLLSAPLRAGLVEAARTQ